MRVDTHMHLYASAEEGRHDTTAYPIVEYGRHDGVRFSSRAGTVEDGLAALADAGMSYAAVLGSYELPALPFPPGGERHWPVPPAFPEHASRLCAYNGWLCSLGARHPELLPFVTVNPAVMTGPESAAHVDELIHDRGARGMKLHPIAIRTYPDDPGLRPVFEVAADAGIPIVVHAGPDVRGFGWALPAALAAILDDVPHLLLVLAHLGGASWRDVTVVAELHPELRFDVSEIVNWAGAPNGATADEISALVRRIGTRRVLCGSDFPWYDPADTVAAVEALPGLTAAERADILGLNAARLLRLG